MSSNQQQCLITWSRTAGPASAWGFCCDCGTSPSAPVFCRSRPRTSPCPRAGCGCGCRTAAAAPGTWRGVCRSLRSVLSGDLLSGSRGRCRCGAAAALCLLRHEDDLWAGVRLWGILSGSHRAARVARAVRRPGEEDGLGVAGSGSVAAGRGDDSPRGRRRGDRRMTGAVRRPRASLGSRTGPSLGCGRRTEEETCARLAPDCGPGSAGAGVLRVPGPDLRLRRCPDPGHHRACCRRKSPPSASPQRNAGRAFHPQL